MLKIFNSIFPKVCKNGFRTFVPGNLDMYFVWITSAKCFVVQRQSSGRFYAPPGINPYTRT